MQIFDEQFIISGNDIEELRLINHTTTLENAIKILHEGITSKIPSKRESGVSELKASVVWTTPNEWKNEESTFGCVSFDIEWDKIIGEFNRIYKVEDEELIRIYDNPTYRLLFTKSIYNNDSIVRLFDPKLDKGPIELSYNKWYKKCDRSLVGHFLLEIHAITMDKISRITFVEHRRSTTMNRYICGSAFLSYILSKNLRTLNRVFKVGGVYDGNLISYINYIKTHKFDDLPPKLRRASRDPQLLIRQFLWYYYLSICEPRRADEYDRKGCKILESIGGRREATEAFYSCVNRHFESNFRQMETVRIVNEQRA